jgi:hypothetical protein
MKTGKEHGEKKEVVVGTGSGEKTDHGGEVIVRQRAFAGVASGETLSAASEGTGNETMGAMVADVREKIFQVRA